MTSPTKPAGEPRYIRFGYDDYGNPLVKRYTLMGHAKLWLFLQLARLRRKAGPV